MVIYEQTDVLERSLAGWSGEDPLLVDVREFVERRYELYDRLRAAKRGGA